MLKVFVCLDRPWLVFAFELCPYNRLFESTTCSNKEDWDQCIVTIAAHNKGHGQLEFCKTWVKIVQAKYHQ